MNSRLGAVLAAGAVVATASVLPLDAHKPITSPYTFNEDVFPIVRDRCATCHVAGGVAPMPLTTAEETVPWGESIRLQLVAGHMPPWAAMADGTRLRHAEGLSARELNLVLTWVTGGTPPGAAEKAPAPVALASAWTLGEPDTTLALPETTLAADEADVARELVVPLGAAARQRLRAVDLRPGTPAVVRSARIAVRAAAGADERTLARWVPGDTAVALPAGAAFDMPEAGELVVRVRYKKTWQHEREVMHDRSTVGLYFARPDAAPVRDLTVAMPAGATGAGAVVTSTVDREMRALAITPTEAAAGHPITVDARLPDGRRQRVLAFTPRAGWERRYWFDPPLAWPRGTELETRLRLDEGSARPASGTPLLVIDTADVPR